MIKSFVSAVAAAPLLMACASAGAVETAAHSGENVLVVNGERIIVRDGAHAVRIIQTSLDDRDGEALEFEFDFDFSGAEWSRSDERAFEEEMERLARELASFSMDVDGIRVELHNVDDLEERIELIVELAEREAERAERNAERHAERAERHAERLAEHAERMAERELRRAEREMARAERTAFSISFDADTIADVGLRAAEHGMQAGVRAIDRTLERGWRTENGERIRLTEEETEELQEARDELQEELDELRENRRERHVERESSHRHEYHHRDGEREVRVIERNGETRVWVNGHELEGAEKDTWLDAWRSSEQSLDLDGAPAVPAPPRPPRK